MHYSLVKRWLKSNDTIEIITSNSCIIKLIILLKFLHGYCSMIIFTVLLKEKGKERKKEKKKTLLAFFCNNVEVQRANSVYFSLLCYSAQELILAMHYNSFLISNALWKIILARLRIRTLKEFLRFPENRCCWIEFQVVVNKEKSVGKQ